MANLMTDAAVVASGIQPSGVVTSERYYNVMSESLTGRMQVRSLGGSRREFTISYPPMKRDQFKAVWEFLDALNGSATEFEIYVPEPYLATGDFDFSDGTGCQLVTVRLKNDVQEFSIGTSRTYSYEIDVVEVLT